MNKDQHTPGPWAIARCGENDPKPCGIYSEGIATGMVCSIGTQHESAQANARLIASAPELLEALRAMVARGPFMDQRATAEGLANCEALAKARHAIRQAEATE
jgi:hypothetical protein